MIPYGDCAYFEGLYSVMKTCYPYAESLDIHNALRALMIAPQQDKIKLGEESYYREEMIDTLRQAINEENNPESFEERYNRLLESALKIIKHMNDGYITPEDYSERQEFILRLNNKEFLLFTILNLMKTTEIRDEEKEQIIAYKIGRVRELKDLIIKYTRNEVSVNTDFDDYEKAKIIYKMLKSLQNLGYGYTISRKEKENLGINHEDDEDLSPDFAYENWIKRIMILQLRREEYLNSRNQTNSIDDLTRISGKLGHCHTLLDDVGPKISELRGIIQKRKFDSQRFNMLEQQNNK